MFLLETPLFRSRIIVKLHNLTHKQANYMELLEAVKRGERPSNIRDINDQPPNHLQPVPKPAVAPKPKPWEVGQTQIWNGSSGLIQSQQGGDNLLSSSNGGGSSRSPWWSQTPARITEIEPEYEQSFGSSGIPTNGERLTPPRSWVPPQPPPVSMAEAAAAIRQPKKSLLQKDPTVDDQSPGDMSGVSEDLQMITKISESGGGSTGGIAEGNGDFTSGDSMAPLSEAGTTLE